MPAGRPSRFAPGHGPTYSAETRRRYRAEGRCHQCGRKREAEHALCLACRAKYGKAEPDPCREGCGRPARSMHADLCQPCRERSRKANSALASSTATDLARKNRAAGLCGCGAVREDLDFRMCRSCRAYQAKRGRAAYLVRKAARS